MTLGNAFTGKKKKKASTHGSYHCPKTRLVRLKGHLLKYLERLTSAAPRVRSPSLEQILPFIFVYLCKCLPR